MLPLPLLVHGVQDWLPFGVVPPPKVVDLLLHLLVKVGHPARQFFVGQVLELETTRFFSRTILKLSYFGLRNRGLPPLGTFGSVRRRSRPLRPRCPPRRRRPAAAEVVVAVEAAAWASRLSAPAASAACCWPPAAAAAVVVAAAAARRGPPVVPTTMALPPHPPSPSSQSGLGRQVCSPGCRVLQEQPKCVKSIYSTKVYLSLTFHGVFVLLLVVVDDHGAQVGLDVAAGGGGASSGGCCRLGNERRVLYHGAP